MPAACWPLAPRPAHAPLLICCAAVVISVNWGGYIWGVNNGRVVETSLGYFINPLVTVLMGVLILGERLRRLQWVAMAIALVAVVVLTLDYGRPPWVALVLAFSFGTYGLAQEAGRRRRRREPHRRDRGDRRRSRGVRRVARRDRRLQLRLRRPRRTPLLFTTTGVVTAVPLHAASAPRRSGSRWSSLGLLQYLAPTIQFALGLLVFHEDDARQPRGSASASSGSPW